MMKEDLRFNIERANEIIRLYRESLISNAMKLQNSKRFNKT